MERDPTLHNATLSALAVIALALVTGGYSHAAAAQDTTATTG
jgi:hypothetical protein